MSNPSKCPQCGAALPDNAPAGLCPNCLMALNLKTETAFTDDSPAAQPPLPPEQIAPHFPQLEILECLGRGGMGVVYKARQKTLNRFVALKLLAPERVNDPKFAERFTREAQALAALNHPNIVTIYDFGQAGGFYFLLMEFVDGVNLRHLLRSRKLTPEEALAIVPSLCDALQFAHERGIVHRDIKPENLLLDKTGRIKVADFGIAKMLGAISGGSTSEPAAPDNATKNALGTPGYSAPEQIVNPQRVDSRADIYSLGIVFYEMLTGELPGSRIEPPSKKIQIDVRLDAVVMRALEKTPELRWQTAADLRTQVETIVTALQTGAVVSNVGPATAQDLNGMRLKAVIWGFLLAAGCLEIALNVSPAIYSWIIGSWGIALFAISTILVLSAKGNLKQITAAAMISSINGIGTACAGTWIACNSNPPLSPPWFDTIVVACGGGIIYCLRCLVLLSGTRFPSSPSSEKKRVAPIVVCAAIAFASLMFALITTHYIDQESPEVGRLLNSTNPTDRYSPVIAYWSDAIHLRRYVLVPLCIAGAGGILYFGWLAARQKKSGLPSMLLGCAGLIAWLFLWHNWQSSQLAAADESSWSLDGDNLAALPPMAVVRAHAGGKTGFLSNHNKIIALGVPLGVMISYAYSLPQGHIHWSTNRVILGPGVADGKFDFIDTVPDHPQEALQAEINKLLGVVVHRESRDADGFVLAVSNPNAGGLTIATEDNSSDSRPSRGVFKFTNVSVDDLGDYLETVLGKVVVDETQLSQKYSGTLRWNPDAADKTQELEKVLSEQFGLQLMPQREPVEMLVVESFNPPAAVENGSQSTDAADDSQSDSEAGWQLWQARKMDQANAMFQKAVQADPNNTNAWNGLGWVAFNTGKPQEAEQDFEKVLSLDSDYPAALNGLGQIYLSEKKYGDAEKYLLQAAPQAPAAWYGLARLYLLQGKFADAQKWAQQVVDSGQGDQIAIQMLSAAKEKQLPDDLRITIEPMDNSAPSPAPANTNAPPAGTSMSLDPWPPALAPGQKPDLNKIRNDIQVLIHQGNYDDALQRQTWYFDHALEYGESDAVRLSFGMMGWQELVRQVPTARQQLIGIRDRDIDEFKAAASYTNWVAETASTPPGQARTRFALYQEIHAINDTLGDNDSQSALTKMLITTDPKLAQTMGYKVADDAYDKFMKKANAGGDVDDGQAAFAAICRQWEELRRGDARIAQIDARVNSNTVAYWAQRGSTPPFPLINHPQTADTIFVDKTRKLIAILVSHGHETDAQKIQDQAAALVDDPWLKSAVSDALAKNQNPPAASANP